MLYVVRLAECVYMTFDDYKLILFFTHSPDSMAWFFQSWDQYRRWWLPCTFLKAFRAWLHGEFQPGLKFRSAHLAEILLRLHAQFQPGRKTLISVRKFTEVRKHNRYACSRSFFSPGWKNDSDYMDFSARLAGLKILARFENTGLGFSAGAESLSM